MLFIINTILGTGGRESSESQNFGLISYPEFQMNQTFIFYVFIDIVEAHFKNITVLRWPPLLFFGNSAALL